MTNLQTITQPEKLTIDLSQADAIINLIEVAVKQEHCAIALGIKNCIAHKVPAWKILKDIRQMAEVNYSLVSTILGPGLTNQIVNF